MVKYKILYIENDKEQQQTFIEVFNNHYEITLASNISETIEILKSQTFDTIIISYRVKDSSLTNFINEIKAPIIFISECQEPDSNDIAESPNIYDYLIKDCHNNYHLKVIPIRIERIIKHYKIEKQLKENETKYRLLVENLNEGIWQIDKDSYTVFVNTQMANMLGYTKEEMIGKQLFYFMDEKAKIIAENNIKRGQEGIKENHDFEFIRKDGKRIYTTLGISPLFDKDGNYAGAIASISDITKRREDEKALIESKDRLISFMNSATDSFISLDSELNFIEINSNALDLIEQNKENVIGKNIQEIIPIISKKEQIEKYLEVMKTGNFISIYDIVIPTTNKGDIHIDIKIFKVGTGIGIIATDVTTRQLAETIIERERNRAQKYLNIAQVILLALNKDGIINMINPKGCQILEYDEEELIGRKWIDVCIPDERKEVVRNIFDMAMSGKKELPEYVENEIITKTGKRKTIAWNNTIITNEKGEITGTLSSGEDITIRKKNEEKLRLLSRVFECSNDAIAITDPKANIIDVNDSFTEITGYTKEEALGKNMNIMKSGKHDKAFYRKMWESLLLKRQWSGEIWDRRKNGEIYPKWVSISSITDENDDVLYYMSIFSDITVIKQAEEKLRQLAHYDMLTNLPNRVLFLDRLETSLNAAERYNQILAVMFLDLDGFKLINDTFGHRAGDQLLIEVAYRISCSIRKSDTAARLGGDEFTIIMTNISGISNASNIAKRIIKSLAKPFIIENKEVYITASLGIALYPFDGETSEELIKNADTAMYHAKEMGKNNYQFFSENMNDKVRERLNIETNLRKAIEKEEFIMYYQPQINIEANKIVGIEALIRWKNNDSDLILPNKFISIAEETGMIIQIGEWTIKEVCKQLRTLEEMGINNIEVSVNISGKHFNQYDISDYIENVVKKAEINPNNLVLEITESDIMRDFEKVNLIFNKLKKLGVKISIDDFGTGYSSLNYLKYFSVNSLKIDKSFLKDIENDINNIAIAKAIISLGLNLKLDIIAEGVETKEQLQFLKTNGCKNVQGFYFYKPMLSEKVIELLLKQLS